MRTELTDQDLHTLIPGVPITEYDDLDGKTLGELLDHNGHGMLFFIERESRTAKQGHWLCILRNQYGVEVFDPYGGTRDPWYLARRWVSPTELVKLGQGRPMLDTLIEAAGMKANYNETRLQKMKPGAVNTCGRHCVVRLWNDHLDDQDYDAWLQAQGDPDEVVCRLTYAKLGH